MCWSEFDVTTFHVLIRAATNDFGRLVSDPMSPLRPTSSKDLQSYLDAHGPLTEPQIRTVLRSLLSTLGYCHSLGITHRDIKPSNVLLRRPDDLSDICLSDFSTSSILPLSSGQLMKTVVGTPFYLPPEIVRGQPYSPKVDVYSLGCMAFQLAYGHTPFEGSRSFMDLYARIAGDDWTFPENSGGSTDFKQFVSQLLHPDPLTRPSADDALRHPFLSRRDSNPSRYGLEKRLSGVHVVFQDGELRFAVPEAVGVWASGAVLAI